MRHGRTLVKRQTRGTYLARVLACWLLGLALGGAAAPARADEIHVMVSGGFTAPYKVLVAEWEKASGHTVTTVYGASMGATPTAIPNRLARGEAADVVILARTALDQLAKDGKIVEHSEVDLVRSRIGMAVKTGAKKPDISTEARFRQVLLDAESLAYSDSASGVYISTEMFKRLGIADQMAPKSRLIPGTPVGESVAKGEVEIGFQQISELLPVPGITVVGPVPASVQMITTFSAGVVTTSRAQATARQLLAYLSSKHAFKTIRLSGLEPMAATARHVILPSPDRTRKRSATTIPSPARCGDRRTLRGRP
jgi:molybdate transport system substrate-binding protein